MKNKAILLIEDNPDDVILTQRAFKKNNITNELVVVNDGVQALDLLLGPDSDGVLPTLILLDLNLPKISGLELLKRIRADERTRRLPVVVLTSSKEDQDIMASYNLGANSYVRKPVSFDEFVEATRQLGLYWLLLNEAPPK
jgi:two-component system response regulator